MEMIIDGYEVTFIDKYSGLPYKSKLPEELKVRLKTRNQWLEEGCAPKDGAPGYEMHPANLLKKPCMYYLDLDVEKYKGECCGNCSIRTGRFCIIAGDYVRMSGCCSEWMS